MVCEGWQATWLTPERSHIVRLRRIASLTKSDSTSLLRKSSRRWRTIQWVARHQNKAARTKDNRHRLALASSVLTSIWTKSTIMTRSAKLKTTCIMAWRRLRWWCTMMWVNLETWYHSETLSAANLVSKCFNRTTHKLIKMLSKHWVKVPYPLITL